MQPALITQHHVRWMIRRDMAKVLEIDALCGGNNTEWYLRSKLMARNCIGMVCEKEIETLTGFVIYELHKDHIVIDSIGSIDADALTSILDCLKRKLTSHRRKSFHYDAPAWNLKLHIGLASNGMIAQGVDHEQDTYRFHYEYQEDQV